MRTLLAPVMIAAALVIVGTTAGWLLASVRPPRTASAQDVFERDLSGEKDAPGARSSGVWERTRATALASQRSDWEALARDLEREKTLRLELEARVRELGARLDALTGAHQKTPASSLPVRQGAGDRLGRPSRLEELPESPEERLERLGFEPEAVSYLAGLIEQRRLSSLYLDHQAEREGWTARDERRARYEKERALRKEVGDEAYDSLLFGTGEPNRLRVDTVIDGSAGAESGLEPQDVVLRYAGERVYSGRQLRELTLQGKPGETVAIEVLRDGDLVRMRLPRGPIGVQLRPFSSDPSSPGD